MEPASVTSDISSLSAEFIALVVLIIVVMFRVEIKALFPRMKSLKGPGFQLDASEEAALRELPGGETAELPEEPDEPPSGLETPGPADGDRAEMIGKIEKALGSENSQEVASRMVDAVVLGEVDLAKRLMERLRLVETDARERKLNEVRYAGLRARLLGDTGARTELEQLATDPDVRAPATRFLGILLLHGGHPTDAAESFATAAAAAEEAEFRAECLALQAKALIAAGKPDDAAGVLESELATHPSTEHPLWEALADTYGALDEPVLRGLALQAALRDNIADTKVRFEAAYALSSSNDSALLPAVVHHYVKVVELDPDAEWALNNLGVAYKNADLPIQSISSYQEACKLGNTLAAANLAKALMLAGFADEAEGVLEGARGRDNSHANVTSVSAQLDAARAYQDERKAELLQLGQRQAEFLLRYMTARVRATGGRFVGTWRNDRGSEFEVAETNGRVAAEWTVNDSKRRFQGSRHGWTSKVDYSEMDYWTYGGKREEHSYEKKLEESSWTFALAPPWTLEVGPPAVGCCWC